jgi:hypothetical protein
MPAAIPNRQNIAAAALLLVVLGGLAIVLLWAVAAGFAGALSGDKGIGWFLLMLLGSKLDPKLLSAITGVLGVGSAFFAGGGLSNRWFYLLVGLAALSTLSCLLLIFLFANDQVASALYNWAPEQIADSDAFRSAANWTLGGTAGWLVAVLGLQVGLHSASNQDNSNGK